METFGGTYRVLSLGQNRRYN